MPSNYLKLRIKNDMGTVGTPSAILGVCSSEHTRGYVYPRTFFMAGIK